MEGVDGAIVADVPFLRDPGLHAEILRIVNGQAFEQPKRDMVLRLALLQAGVQRLRLRAVIDDQRVGVVGIRRTAEEDERNDAGKEESHGPILGGCPGWSQSSPTEVYAVGLSRLGMPITLKPAST